MQREKVISMIKKCMESQQYSEGERLAEQALIQMPKSPVLHNLMGLLLEKENHHVQAMRHFRTAYELNPDYEPARYNLERYGEFCPLSNCMYSDGT